MKKLLAVAVLAACFAAGASAQTPDVSCNTSAVEKKLAGAAKSAHIKKCSQDAQAACEASAKEKKLSGAAANSHVKKCTADKVGTSAS